MSFTPTNITCINASMFNIKLITTINNLLILVSVNISHVTALLKQCRFR